MSAARSASPKPAHGRSRCTRRWFFGASGGAVATAILAACGGAAPAAGVPKASGPPAGFGGGALQILLRSHFVPAYDTWLDAWAKAWGETNKVAVSVDHIRGAQMAEKIAAEVVGQSGHDVVGFTRGGEPQLYADHLVDVADLAKSVGNKYG